MQTAVTVTDTVATPNTELEDKGGWGSVVSGWGSHMQSVGFSPVSHSWSYIVIVSVVKKVKRIQKFCITL